MDWFASQLIKWHEIQGRKNLPWQMDITPYRVWLSEIMLQQTQVSTVIPYFEKFLNRFPNVEELAKSDVNEVLGLWSGLGYYARARNIHKTARIIVSEFGSIFPNNLDLLVQLPGIGRSTAGALLSIAMNIPAPILDGNVKRVLTRFHKIKGYPEKAEIKNRLWEVAESHTPATKFQIYTQAIMDLGATLCSRSAPKCDTCPISSKCGAFKEDDVGTYPGKKPKKPKAIRSVRFFVLYDSNGGVLIEQREGGGVWQGLWGAIQRSTETQPKEILSEFEISPKDIMSLEFGKSFRHTFSHYHLDIEPIFVSLKQEIRSTNSKSMVWTSLQNLLNKQGLGISKADQVVFQSLINSTK
ncbi:MAG: A/G-specific adenine glycosylase [Candidatus Azotimanducaceae bacterium]